MVAQADEVAIVLASTWTGTEPRPFELILTTQDGFLHDTVVDGRWPFTVDKQLVTDGQFKFTLPARTMREVSLRLYRGLQF